MPVLDNAFKCRNGHSFNANAKIRARCPECGELTKRSFTVDPPKLVDDTKPKEKHEPLVRKAPLLVREGRPRLVPTKPAASKTITKKAPAKKAPVAKKRAIVKTPVKALGKTVSGIVKTHKITRVATPKVTGKPKRTAVARHVRVPQKESLIDSVMRRFGPG